MPSSQQVRDAIKQMSNRIQDQYKCISVMIYKWWVYIVYIVGYIRTYSCLLYSSADDLLNTIIFSHFCLSISHWLALFLSLPLSVFLFFFFPVCLSLTDSLCLSLLNFVDRVEEAATWTPRTQPRDDRLFVWRRKWEKSKSNLRQLSHQEW